MAIDWTPARLEVDLNYKSKDIVLASEWNNFWKETRLQGNNNTDGIVLLIEIVEGNVVHLTNLDNLFADLESKVTAHTGNSDIHVTSTQKTAWTAKYDKPSGGIPKTDLASAVQSSLDKADTALQQHQDISALTNHVANNNVHVTADQKNMWSAKYNKPTDGIPKTDLASSVQTSLGKADTALQEHQDISALTNHVANNDIHVTADEKTAWNAKAEVFTITFSHDENENPTIDKTFDEIASAFNNGKTLRLLAGEMFEGELVYHTSNQFSFIFVWIRTIVTILPSQVIEEDADMYLPSANTSDAGKMLTVNSSGNAVWADASASGSGGKSAYTYAVEGGYTLTESDFTTDLGNLHNLPIHISNTNLHIDSAERTAWNAKADVFTIALSDGESGSLTTDKTFSEILEAYNSGKLLRITAEGGMLEGVFLAYAYDTFSFVFITNSTGVYITSDAVGTSPVPAFLPSASFSDKGKILTVDNNGDPAWAEDTKSNKPTFSQYTILTSGWSSGVYSFESDFPSATYDIEIELDSTATESQVEAWSSAKVTSVFGTNTMKALGDVPTVDIPVIVKRVVK